MNPCTHTIRIGGLCGNCGMEISSTEKLYYLYNSDKVQVVENRALQMQAEEALELERMKMLVLILDLDQTVLHTTIEMRGRGLLGRYNDSFRETRGYISRLSSNETTADKCRVGSNMSVVKNDVSRICGNISLSRDTASLECEKTRNIASDVSMSPDINLPNDKYIPSSELIYNTSTNSSSTSNTSINSSGYAPNTSTPKTSINSPGLPSSASTDSILYDTYEQGIKPMHKNDTINYFSLDGITYKVKLRPHTASFLSTISKYYKIYVYTMGTRAYADKIVAILDPEGVYFGDRVLSRDENVGRLDKRLSRLFPTTRRNVVILDDRADVWNWSRNLLLIRPYWYFNKVDINDPRRIREELSSGKKVGNINELKVGKDGDLGNINEMKAAIRDEAKVDNSGGIDKMNEMKVAIRDEGKIDVRDENEISGNVHLQTAVDSVMDVEGDVVKRGKVDLFNEAEWSSKRLKRVESTCRGSMALGGVCVTLCPQGLDSKQSLNGIKGLNNGEDLNNIKRLDSGEDLNDRQGLDSKQSLNDTRSGLSENTLGNPASGTSVGRMSVQDSSRSNIINCGEPMPLGSKSGQLPKGTSESCAAGDALNDDILQQGVPSQLGKDTLQKGIIGHSEKSGVPHESSSQQSCNSPMHELSSRGFSSCNSPPRSSTLKKEASYTPYTAQNDTELTKIERMLLTIHSSYFSGTPNTRRLLRSHRAIFRGMVFYIPRVFNRRPIRKLIELYEGSVSKREAEYILCGDGYVDHGLARRRKCVLVDVGWVLECAYSYSKISMDGWISGDYREEDEYEKELEMEFFGE